MREINKKYYYKFIDSLINDIDEWKKEKVEKLHPTTYKYYSPEYIGVNKKKMQFVYYTGSRKMGCEIDGEFSWNATIVLISGETFFFGRSYLMKLRYRLGNMYSHIKDKETEMHKNKLEEAIK